MNCTQNLIMIIPYLVFDNYDAMIRVHDYSTIYYSIQQIRFRFVTIK